MYKLLEITEEAKQQYESFEGLSYFLQDWEWGEFQKSLGRDVKRFALLDNEDKVIVRGQGILTKLRNKSYLFFPYGPSVSFEEETKFPELLKVFMDHLRKEIPNLIFVRFESLIPFEYADLLAAKRSVDLNPHKTLLLDLSKDEEILMHEMHQKTRYNIRLAEKKGVEIRKANDLGDAGELFSVTAKRAGIRAFDLGYYRSILEYFSKGGEIQTKLYSAWHEGDLLAANVMLFNKDKAVYLFGGSSDIKRNLMAPYLLQWQAIIDGKENGYKVYDFWGVEEDPNHPWHGFSRFKLGFGGNVIVHGPGTYDYVIKPAWYNAYILLRKLNRMLRK
jgi:lipid II:glycine glycyltransferase (peptidoglycan interpeptide bridge formation enzyme)